MNGKYPGAKYLLDLISFFGKYETAKDEEAPGETILGGWIYEYSEISKVADETLGGTKDDFNDVMVENVDDIIKILDDGQKVVKDLKSNFQGIQDGAAQSIIDYSDTIDNYGKLGCKLLFSVIGLINIALAIFVLFICLFSGKMCTNCCCCRCLFKFLTHLLWNILALLMIITFIVGFSLSFTGQVGSDAMSLISYIVSEDNIGDGKENLIVDQLEEARDYLYTCINGDGDIMKKLNMSEESMGSFDELKKAETELDKYIEQFDTIKENKQAYKYAEELLTDRTEDLETENDFGLICQNYDDFQSESDLSKYPSPYLKFKETLSNINDDVFIKAKNEKYDNTCTKEGSCSVDSTCYHPLTCLPHDRAWFGTGEGLQQGLKDNIQIVKDIKEAIKFAGDETKEGSYKSVITDLGAKYDDYLDSYKGVLEEVKGVIKELTDIIIKYTGEEGGLFSFVNCNFVGKNVKIILKYLRDALGKNVYTVGVCLFIVGCSLALSISATILLIIVINISIDENKRDQNKNPEFQFGSSGRVIQYQ